MFMKKLWDRRLLLLSLGLSFIGSTLLMSELGCGQTAMTTLSGVPADFAENKFLGLSNLPAGLTPAGSLSPQGTSFTGLPSETEKPKPPEAPTVWKRDRRRPSFARVYVGDGNSLELVSLCVKVTVDGPRARTTVDHIFRNPHDKQLEGTFEYPLPTGASPSYFAMLQGKTQDPLPRVNLSKVKQLDKRVEEELPAMKPEEYVKHIDKDDWGKLQEARIVARDKALETYEDVARAKIDPALLEYAGGNTFSGRVFPIPAKGYSRVILSYEETLPFSDGDMLYRFTLPECKVSELGLTFETMMLGCSYKIGAEEGNVSLPVETTSALPHSFQKTWKENAPKGEALFRFSKDNLPQVQTIAGRQGDNGPKYVYTRIRPQLEAKPAAPFASHAVFLLDTSLSEHPDRFNVSMKLLKEILQNDPDIKQFKVLSFDVNARWLEPRGWLDNSSKGRETMLSRLDGVLLEGATDVGAALDKLCQETFVAPGTPVNVFLLSDGQITWGENDTAQLVARFESRCPFPTRFHCYRTGLGADNAELFEALTRRGGGIFNCFGEADLAAAAQAHRQECWKIDNVRMIGPANDVLVAGRKMAVYPGGDLIVACRYSELSKGLYVVVEGSYLGKKKEETYHILGEDGKSELAARAWGEVAVASLLSVNDPKLDTLVTAYCQQFSIGSKVASFLVLENDSDYKRLNLEEERGKTVSGDLGSFLEGLWVNLGQPLSERAVYERFLTKTADKVKLFEGDDGKYVKKLLSLLEEADFELPVLDDPHYPALLATDVPASYLQERKKEPRNINTYLTEAKRRSELGDQPFGYHGFGEMEQWDNHKQAIAMRALSNIVEIYPGRADALRLVGYRLLDLQQAAAAAQLFRQVERNRPFEPHSYRDLARGLQDSGKYGLAALQYEIVLAGTWHSRFHDSLKIVAREEYVQMMQQALRDKAVSAKVAELFGERLEGLKASREPSDLRVTISWNTDATDVDLWVIEPDGTKVFYSNRRSKSGGELSEDQTQGYGPERYRIAKAHSGEYKVMVHNFNPNPNLLGGETHVHVVVTRYAGTPRETSQRYNVILKTPKEEVEVTRVKF